MKIFTNHRYALITGIVLAVRPVVLPARAAVAGFRVQPPVARALGAHRRPACSGSACSTTSTPSRCRRWPLPPTDKGGPGGAGIGKYVAPRALFWFRWSALVTWVAGAWLLAERFVPAFTFGYSNGSHDYQTVVIGIGAWLGTIMLLNVWGIIWPNQKKILGIKPATDEEKAKARKVALYASRTNFILSIPMLLCMAATSHGLPI